MRKEMTMAGLVHAFGVGVYGNNNHSVELYQGDIVTLKIGADLGLYYIVKIDIPKDKYYPNSDIGFWLLEYVPGKLLIYSMDDCINLKIDDFVAVYSAVNCRFFGETNFTYRYIEKKCLMYHSLLEHKSVFINVGDMFAMDTGWSKPWEGRLKNINIGVKWTPGRTRYIKNFHAYIAVKSKRTGQITVLDYRLNTLRHHDCSNIIYNGLAISVNPLYDL